MRLAVAALAVLCVAATQSAAATGPIRVLGNQRVLLESRGGKTIACAPSVDVDRAPRMACGLVDGKELAAETLLVSIDHTGLRVERVGTPPKVLFRAREPAGTIGTVQLRRVTPGTLRFRPGRSYWFSGTRVACTATGTAVSCHPRVADAYGFRIGFAGVEVVQAGASVWRGTHR